MTTEGIYNIVPDQQGWRILPTGNDVTLGNGVRLGDYVLLGNDVILGNNVKLGDHVSSDQLNLAAIASYRQACDSHVFVKWVTKDRMSPHPPSASVALRYEQGTTVKADGEVSDQQCAAGLHVFRVGVRPEHVGLTSAVHDLIPLLVRVNSDDILHAGMPSYNRKPWMVGG